MNTLIVTIIIGVGATLIMDVWTALRKILFGIALPNYALVGRWITYMKSGKFMHESIAKSVPVQNEMLIGWFAHYLIGIAFAGVLISIGGNEWVEHPTIGLSLVVGICTVVAPFFLMQPGMGAGIAASRTPKPSSSRFQSILTHSIFGLGLYISGYFLSIAYL